MYRHNYYRDDPRWIKVRYAGHCHCGTEIKPGDHAMYYPRDKLIACVACGQVTESQLADEDWNETSKAM